MRDVQTNPALHPREVRFKLKVGLTEVIKLVDVDHTVTEDQMERIDRLLARNYREHGSAQ